MSEGLKQIYRKVSPEAFNYILSRMRVIDIETVLKVPYTDLPFDHPLRGEYEDYMCRLNLWRPLDIPMGHSEFHVYLSKTWERVLLAKLLQDHEDYLSSDYLYELVDYTLRDIDVRFERMCMNFG